MKFGLIPFFSLLLLFSCPDRGLLDDGAPTLVGRPPQNAYTGLVHLDDGEIRHYGKGLYIKSTDEGLTWDTVRVDDGNLYGKKSPRSGECLRVFSGDKFTVYSARSLGGIDGDWVTQLIDTNGAIMIKPVVFTNNGTRAIAAFHTRFRDGCGTYYSDDDGLTWEKSNQVNVPAHTATGFHKGRRWNHGAVEPTIVELNDGRLWMLIRTAQDHHYESFSTDGGQSWNQPVPSRFYGTITMPTIQRLNNGKLLFIWCNTTPLPELDHPDDYWEDVFTNRDAIHAAISDDDGNSWHGFREIYLNPLRNDSLMATRFGMLGSLDRSVHQSEIVNVDNEQVMVSLGQHPSFRALIKMNTNWLYEKERNDDFSAGLANWSVQKYIKGIEGHCAYNRKPGAVVIDHPNKTEGKVMLLKAEKDTSLLNQHSGAVFNFPSGRNGQVTVRLKINSGFEGMLVSLHDRWFNPTDSVAQYYAMYNFELSKNLKLNNDTKLKHNIWFDLRLEWKSADQDETANATYYIDDIKQVRPLRLNQRTINGISYVHFLLPLKGHRNAGVTIESIKANVW